MPASFQPPLDIPDVEILSVQNGKKGSLLLEVKSTLDYTHCRCCGRKISDRPHSACSICRFLMGMKYD